MTAQNRMISFPYPKFMNAIMDVDQVRGVGQVGVRSELVMGGVGSGHCHSLPITANHCHALPLLCRPPRWC